jgi:hypothetical protein
MIAIPAADNCGPLHVSSGSWTRCCLRTFAGISGRWCIRQDRRCHSIGRVRDMLIGYMRVRSRMASCVGSGTQTGVSSPARRSLASMTASPITKVEVGVVFTTMRHSAAYGFLICEKRFPLSLLAAQDPSTTQRFRHRGAANPTRTSRRKLDRDDQKTAHRCTRKNPYAMSMLSNNAPPDSCPYPFMTQ